MPIKPPIADRSFSIRDRDRLNLAFQEVDYVIQRGNTVCPVEVKAGVRGGMQSMRQFLKEHAVPFGLRLSMENFGRIHDTGILPLYAAHRLCDDTLVL